MAARKKDVETMRDRTTPWQSFFGDEHETDGDAEGDKGRGRIMRVDGAGVIDGADGLGRIERWAEEVVSSLRTTGHHCSGWFIGTIPYVGDHAVEGLDLIAFLEAKISSTM